MKLCDLDWQSMGEPDKVVEFELPNGNMLRVTHWGRDDEYWIRYFKYEDAKPVALATHLSGSRPDGLDPLEAQCLLNDYLQR